MKIFLAGSSCFPEGMKLLKTSPYLLESYIYFKDWQKPLLKTTEMFLVDSGAFTLRKKGENNWEDFIEKYSQFIVKNDIKYFFELDIDNLVGYDKVKKYTERLTELTHRKPIPVWHPNRGIKNYEEMCEKYNYVSIGGIVGASPKVKKKYMSLFPWFIKTAHKYKAQIHGLGFTSQTKLQDYHFDSVDSTSWTSSGRWGHIVRFNGKKLEPISTNNKRIKDVKSATSFNLSQWIRFQEYAKENL